MATYEPVDQNCNFDDRHVMRPHPAARRPRSFSACGIALGTEISDLDLRSGAISKTLDFRRPVSTRLGSAGVHAIRMPGRCAEFLRGPEGPLDGFTGTICKVHAGVMDVRRDPMRGGAPSRPILTMFSAEIAKSYRQVDIECLPEHAPASDPGGGEPD